jgi:SAM-dependent methyltransferase
MLSFLRTQRRELDQWLTERGKAHTFSLSAYALYQGVERLVTRHVSGRCLDAGSGRAPFKANLRARGVDVVSIDIEDRGGGVDHLADIQHMPVIGSESVDSVICTEVLEHVPRPRDALREIMRVLKPGGMLILSVPHLSPIHEAPNDYFRYTSYGVSSLLESEGFEIVELEGVGGVFAFLSHGLSMVLFSSAGAIRLTRPLVWRLNYAFLVRALGLLDDVAGMRSLYPTNIVALARKPLVPRIQPAPANGA